MSAIKTIITGLITGAVASAITSVVIAKVTGKKPDPVCELTGTTLPATECATVTRLALAASDRQVELVDARRRIVVLEETVRLTTDARFFCAGADEPQGGECFRAVASCLDARVGAQVCWHQPEALCFQSTDGATRCGSTVDVCATMATAAGLGAEARGACRRTYVEAKVTPVAPAAPPVPARPPAPRPAPVGTTSRPAL